MIQVTAPEETEHRFVGTTEIYPMGRTIVKITSLDRGQRMGLEAFAEAEAQEGHLYELARGVIEVVDVPNLAHGNVVDNIYGQVWSYRSSQPDQIQYVGTGASCKLLLPGMQSERHPDIAVYLCPPPKLEPIWQYWVPEIVIEVVSPGGEKRDYEEKREEYLAAGVREYWIVDPAADRVLILRRMGDRWEELPRPLTGTYSPPLLPSLRVDLSEILNAYRKAATA